MSVFSNRNITPTGPRVKDITKKSHIGHTRVGEQVRERCPKHPWSKPKPGRECWWCARKRNKGSKKNRRD